MSEACEVTPHFGWLVVVILLAGTPCLGQSFTLLAEEPVITVSSASSASTGPQTPSRLQLGWVSETALPIAQSNEQQCHPSQRRSGRDESYRRPGLDPRSGAGR